MDKMASSGFASRQVPRKRARALLGLLCLLAVLVALTVAAAPWLFSTAALRGEILGQIRAITGLAARAQGRAVFVVLPQPHINIEAIELADQSGALRVEAATLKGYLRVSSLLRGQLQIASATLEKPQMTIDLDRRPAPPDSAIGRAVAAKPATAQAHAADETRLGVVTIVDGMARLRNGAWGQDVVVDAVNLAIDWRKFGARASISGSARLKQDSATVSAVIARPADLLRGGQSHLQVTLDSPALALSADGELATSPKAQFAGRLSAAAPSLRRLAEAAGYFVALPSPLEGFSFDADVNIGEPSASFSNLRLALDGNDYEGALAVLRGEGRPSLTGTLAARRMSLRPFLAQLSPLRGRDGQWSHDPFDLDERDHADVDLRFSAAQLSAPGVELTDAAIALMKSDRRLDVSLIEAKAGRGALKGRASFVKTSSSRLEARLSASFSGVEAASIWPDGGLAWRVSGALTGAASAQGSGSTMSELMRSLDGSGQFVLRDGDVSGVNLEAALRSIGRHPLGLPDDIRYGATGFDTASFSLRISRGVAEVAQGALKSRAANVAFGGLVDLGERTAALHGEASSAGTAQNPAQFAFDVAGPWDDLALIPDARSLIRRSDAAAPLFAPSPKPATPMSTQ